MDHIEYSNTEQPNTNETLAPSPRNIIKTLISYIHCSEKEIMSCFIEESIGNHSKMKFPVYSDVNIYDQLKRDEFAVLSKNLEYYKDQLLVTNILDDRHETLTECLEDKIFKQHRHDIKTKRIRRSDIECKDEKTNFCYVKNCDKMYTTKKALNLHIKKHHEQNELHKDASEMLLLAKRNPKTFINNFKPKKVILSNVFTEESINKRLTSMRNMKEKHIEITVEAKTNFTKEEQLCNEDFMNNNNMKSKFVQKYYLNSIIKEFGAKINK